jgi:peptidoglycan LD-endopeptidase LytH
MFRRLISIVIISIYAAIPAYASVCDDWNALEREIRDNGIARDAAREKIVRLDRELLEEYRGAITETGCHFPVNGYGAKASGGRNGNGYKPAGYNFYDGNRHGGHPAQDIFIRDRDRTGIDDKTGKPAEIAAFTGGVVVAVNPSWEYPSGIRGGIYIWIFNPAENRFYYYAHLQKALVAPGDMVKAGDTIAILGRTGKNARPKRSPTHLHFMCLTFANGRMTPVNTWRELAAASRN